jgi:hypothetical protein
MSTEVRYLDVYRFFKAELRPRTPHVSPSTVVLAGQRDATPHTRVRIVPLSSRFVNRPGRIDSIYTSERIRPN